MTNKTKKTLLLFGILIISISIILVIVFTPKPTKEEKTITKDIIPVLTENGFIGSTDKLKDHSIGKNDSLIYLYQKTDETYYCVTINKVIYENGLEYHGTDYEPGTVLYKAAKADCMYNSDDNEIYNKSEKIEWVLLKENDNSYTYLN